MIDLFQGNSEEKASSEERSLFNSNQVKDVSLLWDILGTLTS